MNQTNKKISIMSNEKINQEVKRTVIINMVGFEFFQIAIKNGFSAEEAKSEMLKKENIEFMTNRANEILSK